MTTISFHDAAGKPVAGATVAITGAPGEVADLGYITGDDGAITLPAAVPGTYDFALSQSDGSRLTASVTLSTDGDQTATATPA